MTFDELLEQALALVQRRGRVSYRALKLQFNLDDEYLEALTEEIIAVHQLATDHEGSMLVWTGNTAPTLPAAFAPETVPARPPQAYPPYPAEKILTSTDQNIRILT
jgi:hypothetical protein